MSDFRILSDIRERLTAAAEPRSPGRQGIVIVQTGEHAIDPRLLK